MGNQTRVKLCCEWNILIVNLWLKIWCFTCIICTTGGGANGRVVVCVTDGLNDCCGGGGNDLVDGWIHYYSRNRWNWTAYGNYTGTYILTTVDWLFSFFSPSRRSSKNGFSPNRIRKWNGNCFYIFLCFYRRKRTRAHLRRLTLIESCRRCECADWNNCVRSCGRCCGKVSIA